MEELQLKHFCWINKIIRNITPARIVFWLSVLVFCVAFFYITYLGMTNVLRYHYIQNIEDRLYDLFPITSDNTNRGNFLHWSAFSAPILTKNKNHITSSHSALSFCTYVGAIICAILFSMGLVIALFFSLNPIRWFDILVMGTMIILMTFSFVLCLRTSSRAADVTKFSWDVAHENQQNRLGKSNKKEYTQATLFKHILKYLIYPKIQDIQKPALIIIGFLYWIIYNSTQINIENIWKLVSAMFIFDFLAYQARYQINDIRGIEEDREFGHKNKLLPEKRDKKYELHVVKISFVVAGLKILLSVGITIILIISKGIYGWFLLICLGILFLSTILYEIVRDTYMYWLIFVCVGIGYPLRFFLGFFVVDPCSFQIMWGMPLICFVFTLWAYGSFASILCWVDEIREHLQRNESEGEARFSCNYKKKHYMYIRDIIRDQFCLAENQQINGVVLPLREKGRLSHPWNIELILSIILLIIIEYIMRGRMIWIILGCLALVFLVVSIYLRYINKLIALCFAFGVFGCKLIMQLTIKDCLAVYFLISITQLLIVITYFVLGYRPQSKKIDLKILLKQIKEKMLGKILGSYIVELKRQLDTENRE